MTFLMREGICEREFEMSSPFWHLYTDGTKMQNIFQTNEEFEIGMTLLAVSACRVPNVKIITFELMNNHVHKILSGPREDCIRLFQDFKRKLRRIWRARNKIIDWEQFQENLILIDNLKSLRNEIIYVNRNAFVANPNYTPYNYQWGGGYAYFNSLLEKVETTKFSNLTYNEKRRLTRCRDISGLERLEFVGDSVYIPSFCDIKLGECLFYDARSYFNSLTRNAESFRQIAVRLKDSVFMTDDELHYVASKLARADFNETNITCLSPEQKIKIAKELKFTYNATKQQIRRITKLELNVITDLFG